MLQGNNLISLPLEIRIQIAQNNMDTYEQMYVYDPEFREYAKKQSSVEDFIESFVKNIIQRPIGFETVYKFKTFELAIHFCGDRVYKLNKKAHRLDGPAITYYNGSEEWYLNGQLHRDDGPAVTDFRGNKRWYLNGKLHRDNGPALIDDSTSMYYKNGQIHRNDGPAVIDNGRECYYIYGHLIPSVYWPNYGPYLKEFWKNNI